MKLELTPDLEMLKILARFYPILFLVFIQARANPLVEAWKGTEIGPRELNMRLSTCEKSPQHRDACFRLLDVWLSVFKESPRLIHRSQWTQWNLLPKAIWGELAVINRSDLPPLTPQSLYNDRQKIKSVSTKDFQGVYSWIQKTLENQSIPREYFAGQSLDQWYKAFDPFNRLVPLRAGQLTEAESTSLAPLAAQNLQFGWLKDLEPRRVLFIRLMSFADPKSCGQMYTGFTQLLQSGPPEAVILDLRYNLGGFEEQMECWLEFFLPPGLTAYSTAPLFEDVEKKEYVTVLPQMTEAPLFILQNGATASVAEMFSAVLQDFERAWILGDRSFGKGVFTTGRNGIGLRAEGRFTPNSKVMTREVTSLFLSRGDRIIQRVGVPADFEIQPKDLLSHAIQRAEDLFPNLRKVPGAEAINRELPDSVLDCLKENTSAEKEFLRRAENKQDPDFELLRTTDVVTCHLENANGKWWNPFR